jgi:predicted secreted protein
MKQIVMNFNWKKIEQTLRDERSRKVAFVSHCILNENTRYLGGASRKGAIEEIVQQLQREGIGIVQMKCPEQKAWGGVLKKVIWKAFDSKEKFFYSFKGILIPAFEFYTRIRYRKLAKEVVEEIAEYLNSGFEVVGLIGVDGSPSCGVLKKLSLSKSLEVFASSNDASLERTSFNEKLFSDCLQTGSGVFIDELKKQLERRKISIKFYSVELVSEMMGKRQTIEFQNQQEDR